MIVTKCDKCYFYQNKICSFNIKNILLDNFSMLFNHSNMKDDDIYDFYCPYARTNDWVEQKIQSGSTKLEIEKEILSNKPSFTLIYFLDDNEINMMSNLDVLISSGYKYIYFVARQNRVIQPKVLIEKIQSKKLQNWKLQYITDNDMTECEIIDMILDGSSYESELIYIINNKESISSEQIDTVLDTFNLLRSHEIVFLPTDILSFHNIVIPTNLWKHKSNRIGLALSLLENDTSAIKLTLQ